MDLLVETFAFKSPTTKCTIDSGGGDNDAAICAPPKDAAHGVQELSPSGMPPSPLALQNQYGLAIATPDSGLARSPIQLKEAAEIVANLPGLFAFVLHLEFITCISLFSYF